MPLSGVHIAFGTASEANVSPGLISGTILSQTMATGQIATIKAPSVAGGQPMLSIAASAPIYFATGGAGVVLAADGSIPRRYYDPSTGPLDIFVNPGDGFVWQLA